VESALLFERVARILWAIMIPTKPIQLTPVPRRAILSDYIRDSVLGYGFCFAANCNGRWTSTQRVKPPCIYEMVREAGLPDC
jgi:hypothetical protein